MDYIFALEHPLYDLLARAGIFQFLEFLYDLVTNGFVIGRINNTLWPNSSKVNPDTRRRSENFTAKRLRPFKVDLGKRSIGSLSLIS
jgi:hypothetical protein